jgi:Protein of unknown function (DUF3768)
MARAAEMARAGGSTYSMSRRLAVVNNTQRIRELNDDLRQHLLGSFTVMTPGVAALGQQTVERIVQTISVFDDFCHANDPNEEHDFGSFKVEARTIFFKIDYYDKNYLTSPAHRREVHRTSQM